MKRTRRTLNRRARHRAQSTRFLCESVFCLLPCPPHCCVENAGDPGVIWRVWKTTEANEYGLEEGSCFLMICYPEGVHH
jgi:hypothetical protein